MDNSNVDVSVLLITYNPSWEKLELTLDSILLQTEIKLEIIIADDGSEVDLDGKIIEYFNMNEFANYKFANSSVNVGTCWNLDNALKIASGKYSKAISPGDLLFNESTLYNWFEFMEQERCDVSFGDAVYYRFDSEKIKVIHTKNSPVHKHLFSEDQSRRKTFVNYLLANDTILGATIMMRTELMKKYLAKFIGRVIYAEDYIIRLMLFENITVRYFPSSIVWYEYGTGISTSKIEKWAKLLSMDFDASNEIIEENNENIDSLAKKYKLYLRAVKNRDSTKKIIKCLLFPDTIYWRIRSKLVKKNAYCQIDTSFINQLFLRR
ncbi:glycosyltransferase [Candidatus Enterococcus ferrettii]|uniref:Glycosyltransferase 2-like domain-containing protein n=1 Tax=Candidatus Enterococcus ferrettii TaxID=2815324 RepID=A0ABV0EIB4_9ENTE|nr:glycosyltransferase family 2 protein [Enterococcus sp. 665A]MBO1341781.1 glycosyltransferase family 2 protein [Enterococcus sp. 665A]